MLISDAGSPLISDPGYKLVQYCISQNVPVTTVPGPSSLIPALQLAGLPINEFYFAGFLPKNKKGIIEFILKIKEVKKTSVFFVSNHKIEICLNILEDIFGNIEISVSKELTKINEKVWRGDVKEVSKQIINNKDNLKGEFIIVVGESTETEKFSPLTENLDVEIKKLLSKFSLTDVVEIVHKITGIKKNKVYKWILKIKKL